MLFASDWGDNAQVFSSGLDGKGKTTVSSKFYWPNGLTLDLNNKKLYILDGLEASLSSCNYDGSDFQQLFKSTSLLQHAFGLTYFSNKLFLTSWKDKRLISLDLSTKNTAVDYSFNKVSQRVQFQGFHNFICNSIFYFRKLRFGVVVCVRIIYVCDLSL